MALIFPAFLLSSGVSQEFREYENGLIYSPATIEQLSFIADSMDSHFASCDFSKTYYSKYQATGISFSLTGDSAIFLYEGLQNGMSLEEGLTTFPGIKTRKDVHLIFYEHKNWEGEEQIRIDRLTLTNGTTHILSIPNESGFDQKQKIYFTFSEGGEYSSPSLRAVQLYESPARIQLEEKYAEMIGYAECMIDTNTVKIYPESENNWLQLPENVEEISFSKKIELLEQWRNTRVIGMCSQDIAPRIHAIEIAFLAAETANWEVFLKAHLDIMNDRFERVSDGSYAWNERKTYIKELEELEIDLTSLLLGISFRIDNPAENHYYGNVWRLGRAISESEQVEEFEQAIVEIVQNEELDFLNRALGYFLFDSYVHNLPDETKKAENELILEELSYIFPESFRE